MWFVVGGAVSISILLSPPADLIADANLTVHMFQHIGLFALSIVLGYGLERYVISKLGTLRKLTYIGWKAFTSVMVANTKTRGVVFVVALPAITFAYWHVPLNFDLAVQNESVHVLEHLTYIVSGSLVGLSFQAIKPKWQVSLLYVAFMHAGIMGSIWSVWTPPYFPLYSSAANIDMDTTLLVFGAIGVVVTSSWMLKVLDII
ncbi:MAG: DUF1404 domain-containing protein [Thaumarchaeota archaeon]|nr:DUF1404 domain-containing protein [Nitrososphaerota archaeon]